MTMTPKRLLLMALLLAGATFTWWWMVQSVDNAMSAPRQAPRHTAGLFLAEARRWFKTPKRGNLVLAQFWVRYWAQEQGATFWNFTVTCTRRSRKPVPGIGYAVQAVTHYKDGATARQHWTVKLRVPHWARTKTWRRGVCLADAVSWNGAQPAADGSNFPGLEAAIFFLAPPRAA